MEQQSLYERLGGVNAIAMVVDRFSDAIIENPKLQGKPTLREWNESGQLPGLKFMRTLWLCQQAGGPFEYTGKELGEAHKDLHITSDEFDEVGAEIASWRARSLQRAGARKAGSRSRDRRKEERGGGQFFLVSSRPFRERGPRRTGRNLSTSTVAEAAEEKHDHKDDENPSPDRHRRFLLSSASRVRMRRRAS